MTMFLTLKLADEAATEQLAQNVAAHLRAGDLLFLSGELGAGKTTFTRHLIKALGLDARVKSPTYTLLESYELPSQAPATFLHHFDLYRLSDPREWFSAGFEEYLNSESLAVIEWADKAKGALPKPDWHIHLTYDELKDIPAIESESEPQLGTSFEHEEGDLALSNRVEAQPYLDVVRFVVIEAISSSASTRIVALKNAQFAGLAD